MLYNAKNSEKNQVLSSRHSKLMNTLDLNFSVPWLLFPKCGVTISLHLKDCGKNNSINVCEANNFICRVGFKQHTVMHEPKAKTKYCILAH